MAIQKPNYTQIPNVLIDNMFEMTHTEFKTAMFICRQTFGFHRQSHKMSISYIERGTGLSHETVVNNLQTLGAKGILSKLEAGQSFSYALDIEHFDDFKLVGNSDQSPEPTSRNFRPVLVGNSDHQLVGNLDTNKESGLKKEKENPSAVADGAVSVHKQIITRWFDDWIKYHGVKYETTGQDCAHLTRFLKMNPNPNLNEMMALAAKSWRSPRELPFVHACSIAGFFNHINEIRVALAKKNKVVIAV